MEGAPKRLTPEIKKGKDFSYIEGLLENFPMNYGIEDIINEIYPNEYEYNERQELYREVVEYGEYLKKKREEEKQKEALERAKDWTNYGRRVKEEEKEYFKEILKNVKENFVRDIEKFIAYEKRENPKLYKEKGDNQTYWVGVCAKKSATKYFEIINKVGTDHEINNIKDEIKDYYYKSLSKPYTSPFSPQEIEKARDRYEVSKDDGEDSDPNEDSDLENRIDHSL